MQQALEQPTINLTDAVIVGAYSVDENGNFKNDMSALKYLKKSYWKAPQDVNFDLKEIGTSMEATEVRDHNYLEKLNNLTKFIQENPENIIKNKRVDADFVCFRGVLRWILQSIQNYQGFILEAVKLKETIYLALKTVKEPFQPHLKTFDSCLLSSDPNDESAAIKKDEFNIVLTRKVDELKILFAAECRGIISEDAVESMDDFELSKVIEVKCRVDSPVHYIETYRDLKLWDYWCQSFIASIDTIYLGKRDDQNIVNRIEKIDVKSLEDPEHSSQFWTKNACLKRLREFLRHIIADMHGVDDPCTVFVYEWKERSRSGPKNPFPIWPKQLNDEEFLSRDYISFINDLK